mmetsp:Transcript_19040/g.44762  ORF Transcript_19040/g.44762 Transcript_19040/m.44762 type:complete len:92 (+) Transcript_19040:42-317(+)
MGQGAVCQASDCDPGHRSSSLSAEIGDVDMSKLMVTAATEEAKVLVHEVPGFGDQEEEPIWCEVRLPTPTGSSCGMKPHGASIINTFVGEV